MLGELTIEQINNLLSSQVVGRLACVHGKQPYIVPMTYAFDGTYIYGQTNEGTKLAWLRKNPLVCFEVDLMMDMRNWQSVVVYGKFEELKDINEKEARVIFLKKVYPLSTSSTVHPYGHRVNGKIENGTRIKQVMYRIKIKMLSGRYEKQ